jgi:hypothetical protein
MTILAILRRHESLIYGLFLGACLGLIVGLIWGAQIAMNANGQIVQAKLTAAQAERDAAVKERDFMRHAMKLIVEEGYQVPKGMVEGKPSKAD